MELYLTLAIAVGGIATRIGAIWTAAVARRQLNEQRLFIQEQNERARISLQEDLMSRLHQQWMSSSFVDLRTRSIQFMAKNLFVEDQFVEPEYVDVSIANILEFFDQMGYLIKTGVLPIERVVAAFAGSIRLGWALWEPAVKKDRERRMEPDMHANFEYLYHQTLDFNAKRGGAGTPPTKEEVRMFAEAIRQGDEDLNPDELQRQPAVHSERGPRTRLREIDTAQTS